MLEHAERDALESFVSNCPNLEPARGIPMFVIRGALLFSLLEVLTACSAAVPTSIPTDTLHRDHPSGANGDTFSHADRSAYSDTLHANPIPNPNHPAHTDALHANANPIPNPNHPAHTDALHANANPIPNPNHPAHTDALQANANPNHPAHIDALQANANPNHPAHTDALQANANPNHPAHIDALQANANPNHPAHTDALFPTLAISTL